ncbi:uncharacterized protein Triagg1_595 [Trichoderma aggressivum f. europaeum]|uniref:Uncharacterized protein n=1 Tax=Trichoderma aggressivum f. europaeum TaxID=173218 RepID=A0AAE1IM89_9HYPO|nr:hypothetical protein Triagg1_595 [Trichoderma aggressivum f. europaeum]
MPTPSVLLETLLPVNAVRLGRLVLDVRNPEQDFFEPDESTTKVVIAQQLDNFSYSSKQGASSGLHLILSTLISGQRSSENCSKIDLSSSICITRRLENSGQFFGQLCEDSKTRYWLERALRKRQDVYLVTGTRTVADAKIGITESKSRSSEGKAQVPASLAAGAVGIPFPDGVLDIGTEIKRSVDGSDQTDFVAPGEQIFAVQYRKVRVSWFSNKDVDRASLESGNRWKVYLGARGEGDEAAEKVVDMQVGDYVQNEDFDESYELLDGNGDTYLRF